MALTLTLDHSLNQLAEPGFWRFYSGRDITELGDLADSASNKGIWADAPTGTIMLRPLQFDPTWINTSQQHDSIIHLDQMTVAAADTAAQTIFQAPAFGNNDNPYIFHVPVGGSTAFPAVARPRFPGAAPSLTGIVPVADASSLDSLLRVGNDTYRPSTTVHPSTDVVAPIAAGSTSSGKFVVESPRLDPNQGLLFRWHHPHSQLGFPVTYGFFVGEYCLRIKDVTVEVFRDISPSGTRDQWRKITQAPLFSVGDLSTPSFWARVTGYNELAHDRQLLFLPYRRNEILLQASTGRTHTFQVNNKAVRLSDDSDWQITRGATVLVWVQTPAPGRFQIQKLKYPSGPITVRVPTITLDYTPTFAPTETLTKDSDHGSMLTSTLSQPASYTLPTNDASTCPAETTTATDQRRNYGIELVFNPSSDNRWTPFCYGVQTLATRRFISTLATPVILNNTVLVSARLSAGTEPGQGRLTAVVNDPSPYPLIPFYYRCSFPISLKDGSTFLFIGLTAPTEVTPIHGSAAAPWRLTFSALDRWKALADTKLRDQRDWTGTGHIDVVRFICEQAGIDCSTAEFPSGYTANVISTINSALGGSEVSVKQHGRNVKPGWQPRATDTAASFIKRIVDLYSDWYVGFRLDGTFFYLPRTNFTTPTVTFAALSSGTPPFFYDTVTFTTIEPEANIVAAMAGDLDKGSVQLSSAWVDYQSIKNPHAVNYLGRPKQRIIQVGGAFTCPQLNWIARKVWDRARRRRLTVSFEAEFVPSLEIGHVCTLGSYGNYRITGFTADLNHENDRRATYSGELVETGVQVV